MATEEEREHAVQQLAMFMQARDARTHGIVVDHVPHPTWAELLEFPGGTDEYLQDATAIVQAIGLLGWEPVR